MTDLRTATVGWASALEKGAEGVIIAQGGAFAGWSLYAKDGRPTYCYNLLGLQRFKIEAESEVPKKNDADA